MSDFVWIANQGDNTVSKIDKASTAVVATIALSATTAPYGVAVDTDSVWVTGQGAPNCVTRISKNADTISAEIFISSGTFAVAADPDSVWVTGSNILSEIDKDTNAVTATTSFGSTAWGVAVDSEYTWVTTDAGAVAKVDKDTNTIVATISIAPGPRGIAVDQDSVWVAHWGADTVLRIDKATDTVLATIPTGAGTRPHGIAVDDDFVWAATHGSGAILKIDKDTNTIVDTINVIGGPHLHGVSVDAGSAWTDGYFQNTTYRINKDTAQIAATIPVGQRPDTFGDFTGFAYDSLFGQPIQQVQIDVKPGSDPNSINLANNGVIAVAIYTRADFDASQVDVSTVLFAGANVAHSALEDVDGDGDLDMILHFRTQETNLRDVYAQLVADDINADGVLDSNKQETEVSLTGQTLDDLLFSGTDELSQFLAGKSLRNLLDELAALGVI